MGMGMMGGMLRIRLGGGWREERGVLYGSLGASWGAVCNLMSMVHSTF